jgi:hypothetical protein
MSDYTKTTNFTAKDGLATGNALKVIKGSYFDTEFDNIVTAVATKYDSTNIASTAQAEALTSDAVLITPSGLNDVLVANSGSLGDIQALADPGADRILFWDDSAGAAAWLTPGNGIETSTTSLQITDSAVSTTNPIGFTSGAPIFDASALTSMEGNALAGSDIIIVEDGGAPKQIAIQDMGMRVQLAQATQTLAADDMNSIMEFTATATLTLPLNATTALPIGTPVVLNMKHATQELTITAAASVTLVSKFHPAGAAAASDVLSAGGTALLYKTAADVWCLSGDIKDA